MTTPRASLVFVLLSFAVAAPGAHAAAVLQEPSARSAPAAPPPVLLAQKEDKDKDKDKDKDAKARAKAIKEKVQAEKAKQNAAKQKQQADKAKNNAAKQKQQVDAAKEKAAKQKQQAQQAREKALKAKQDALEARQKAVKEKQQQQVDKAKNNAAKQKQDSDAARQKALKDKQQQLQQAKDKAAKQKQDAEAAALKALKGQQQHQEAKEKVLKQKQHAQEAREKAAKEKAQAQQARDKAVREKLEAEAARKKKQAAKKDRPTKFDRAKADAEFERARKRAQEKGGKDRGEKFRPDSAKKFEALRKGRKTREVGKRNIIVEADNRVIIRNNNRTYIRHDERARIKRKGRELRRERRKDGTLMVVTMGLAGALIYSLQDDHGRVLRRSRKDRNGREYVLFDDRHYHRHEPRYLGPDDYRDTYVDLPPPVVRIPREQYIVDYDHASPDDIYDALNAPPIEELDRGYSLDEVRQNYSVLERMRRVDLDAINFEFASWEVPPDQYPKLERMARAIQRVLDRSPGELFLIEGHTDAVGDEVDNLSLSDRRAETVAMILSDSFGVPPENLTTQGYGEEYLKEPTEEPSFINRRVSVRRITPLLSREGWDDPN